MEIVGAQPTVPILHCKTFVPRPKLIAVVVGEFGAVIVPLPDATDHVPVPTAGLFPFKFTDGEVIQTVWLEPAKALLGKGSIVIITLDCEELHTPFDMVHKKIFWPKPKFVAVVVPDVGVVIVADPSTTVHKPVPTVGIFPAIVKLGFAIHNV